jgi:hypothetical protein
VLGFLLLIKRKNTVNSKPALAGPSRGIAEDNLVITEGNCSMWATTPEALPVDRR